MCTTKGFIIIDRAIQDWQYWDDMAFLGFWIHILLKANWKDGWFMGQKIEAGSFACSAQKLADECNVSRSTVLRWLKRLKNAQQIEVKANNQFTQIFVINYAKYQAMKDERDTTNDTPSDTSADTPSDTSSEQRMIHNRTKKQRNKEINNINNNIIGDSANPVPKKKHFVKPTIDDIKAYIDKNNFKVDGDRFFDYYEANGWKVGNSSMKDWKAAVRNWNRRQFNTGSNGSKSNNYVKLDLPEYYNQPIEEDDTVTSEEAMQKMQEAIGKLNGDL